MIRVGATIDGFSDAMKSVVSQASDAADAVADKLESVGDVGKKLAALGASLTAAITIPLEEMARRSLDVAGTFEQTRIAFQSLMGSSAEASGMLGKLYDFAAKTPFEIPQVLDGARKLMALGFAASDIVPILRVVGDQAAALGQGGQGMDRILMNLGKIEAQGHITGRELRNLGEDNVPAIESLSLALGKPKEAVFDMVTKRQIDSETAINAILRGMQLRTGGLMEGQMGSFKGQLSNLKDQITLTMDAIGEQLLPIGKLMVNWAQEAMTAVKELAKWFGQLPGPIQASAIALAALAAAAGPALTAIGGLGFLLPNIMGGLSALAKFVSLAGVAVTGVVEYITTLAAMVVEYGAAATASFAFGDALGAVGAVILGWPGLIVLAIAALAALATWVYTHWEGVKAFLHQVFDGLGEAWSASIGVAVNWLSNTLGFTATDLTRIWTTFKGAFMEIWDAIGSFLHTAIDGFKSDIQDLIKLLEKFPGMQKVFSAGDAFKKADHDASERGEMSDIGKKLRVGADDKPFSLTDKYQADLEKHNAKLKEAVELLAKFKKGYEDGIVSEKDFKQAQANVEFIRQDVPKRESKSEGKAGKVDHNALDKIKGELATEEAAFARQRSEVEHAYQMAQPGSSESVGQDSVEFLAQNQLATAQKRKDALDKLASDELKSKLTSINKELAIDKEGQSGHERILAAKATAEQKYQSEVLANRQHFETLQKQISDRMTAEDLRVFNEDLKNQAEAQTRMAEAQKKHARDLTTMSEETLKAQRQHAEAEMSTLDKLARFRLETGEITKNAYLKIKQAEADKLHELEMQELADAQKTLDMEYEMALLAVPKDRPDLVLGVNDEYQKRQIKLDSQKQQVEDRHKGKTQDIGLEKQKDQYSTVFAPVQSGFASAISNMIKGTQTFRQAWMSMSTGILSSWINSISQMASKWLTHLAMMAAKWVAHKAMELILHTGTEAAKTASSVAADTARTATTMATNVAVAASSAAVAGSAALAWWSAVNPPIAPAMAAATYSIGMGFAGLAAFEQGGLVPATGIAMLHGGEMVLPAPISQGLQGLIESGAFQLPNAGSFASMTQGSGLNATAMHMIRDTAPSGGETHHNYHGPMHYHAAPGESMNVDTFGKLFNTYVRQNNLKMA